VTIPDFSNRNHLVGPIGSDPALRGFPFVIKKDLHRLAADNADRAAGNDATEPR
jgi:hypothetical protein